MNTSTIRSIRIPDDLWEAAQDVAGQEDETLSQVIRRALRDYIASDAQ